MNIVEQTVTDLPVTLILSVYTEFLSSNLALYRFSSLEYRFLCRLPKDNRNIFFIYTDCVLFFFLLKYRLCCSLIQILSLITVADLL